MDIADIQENLNELVRLTDQTEVERITLTLWKGVALELAKRHEDEAKYIVAAVCAELEARWDAVRESGGEAKIMDGLSDFKEEASQNGLR